MPFFRWKKESKKSSKKPEFSSVNSKSEQGAHGDGAGERNSHAAYRSLLRSYSQLYTGNVDDLGGQLTSASRLSKTLHELLRCHEALPYLQQFLRMRGAHSLLSFWLDAQSFQASAVTRVRSHSQLSQGSSGGRDAAHDNGTVPSGPPLHAATHCDTSSSPCDTHTPCHTSSRIGLSHSESPAPYEKSTRTGFSHSDAPAACDTQVASSISAETSIAVSNSSAHGCTTAAAISVSPPRASPCDASGYQMHRNQTRRDSHTSCSKQSDACSSQKKLYGDISNQSENYDNIDTSSKGLFSQSLHDNPANAMQVTDVKLTDTTSSDLSSEQASSVITSPTNQNKAAAVSQRDGQVPGARAGATRQTLQHKLLSNIADDAVRIFSRYIAKDASQPIHVTEELRQDAIRKICREDGLVDQDSFVPCQEFVVQELQERYYSDFLASEWHLQHQIDLLTGSTVLLSDILYNHTALSYFTQFMEQEGALPLLQCWLDLDNFQQFLMARGAGDDWQEAQNDAMVLYDKYFSLQATEPLGLEDAVRFSVECNICREGGPLPDCFSKPKCIVTAAINKEYFPQYLQSEMYMKYLNDLITTVKLCQDLPQMPRRRRDSGSEGSEHSSQSAQSGGRKNTLLAGGRRMPKSATVGEAISKLQPDMSMDAALFNPDALWQRPKAEGLSLAKIDEMGRFVSEFESQPDRDKNTFSDLGIFKRGKEKEKAQQDMALQIANMIIADVNACTQNPVLTQDVFENEHVPK